jgi:hypothetical protein
LHRPCSRVLPSVLCDKGLIVARVHD